MRNLKARVIIEDVIRILQEIRDIDNEDGIIFKAIMAQIPDIKSLGLSRSMGFSHIVDAIEKCEISQGKFCYAVESRPIL